MRIENYGKGKRAELVAEMLRSEYSNLGGRFVLLPIPTTRDQIHLAGTDILIDGALAELFAGDIVSGYAIPKAKAEKLIKNGVRVYDAAEDEEFLSENARLTALGTVGYLLTTSQAEPGDMRFGIVGYGRIGGFLLSYLLYLGSNVIVYTGRPSVRDMLGRNGISTVSMEEGVPIFSGVDVLINTAPTDLSAGFPEGVIPKGMRVIELASGNNLQGVDGVERLPSVPDRSFPGSAAAIYFSAIKKYISEVL